ncbi:hypothetical protein AAMO2058_001685500 [Amorphochlora amoebiformis]
MLQGIDQSALDLELKSFKQIVRPSVKLELNKPRFEIKDKKFVNQYASLYFNRLMGTVRVVKARAMKKWPDTQIASKLIVVPKGKCVLIGTIFKEMKLRPNVLEEFTQLRFKTEERDTYFSSDDRLVIEDSHARIPMKFLSRASLPSVNELVSGVIAGVLGEHEPKSGVFQVEDIVFAGIPEQKKAAALEEDQYVALVSGLHIGDPSVEVQVQMMVDFLTGMSGGAKEHERAAKIVQVVVAGNSVQIEEEEDANYAHFTTKNRSENDRQVNESIATALQDLDIVLTSLTSSVNVVLMPGESDPSNFTLPQQRFPKFMFQAAGSFSTLHFATNPCDASVAGRQLLGTSGQNVDDMAKYSVAKSPIEYLERTLQWRHIAPTAPDTLGCYAFMNSDPFLIEDCPHIYFAANQKAFGTKLVEGENGQRVRLVLVPDFSKTCTIALVNLRTLECEEVKFSI